MRDDSRAVGRPFLVAFALTLAWPAGSADDGPRDPQSSKDTDLIEEVVTTATKKGGAQNAQDVAASISVFGEDALAERHMTDLGDLGMAMPNVAFDGVGTAKGIANFAIRGQGIAGSIPSIDPTVGVFVDGVYLGVNYGVILDTLDLESVEVLRGPQGLLFGRNVTGGAVLLRSRRPSGLSAEDGMLRVETGPEWRMTGSLERPLVDEALSVRVSGSYRDDAGWFENAARGGGRIGADESWVLRSVFGWTPGGGLDVAVIFERGRTDADGPATQNRRRFDGFEVALDEPGFAHVDWRHLIVDANRSSADGRGQLANVFGWRKLRQDSLTDTDSTSQPVFHPSGNTAQEQVSNELRYSRTFEGVGEVTAGVYLFSQEIRHRERRLFRAEWGDFYGGDQDHLTGGVFVSADLDLGTDWVLTGGARYTVERKDVRVATLGRSGCSGDPPRCRFDFEDGDTWRSLTPKVGMQRRLGENAQVYAHYTKGFRGGGYNLRNTSSAPPGPFDEEEQDSFEAGLKSELAAGRVRLNLAAFENRIFGMQRQVTRADVATGGVQVTANTADATISGFEAETVAGVGRGGRLAAFVGYTDGAYDKVRFDLNADGTTVGDEHLDLPRLARLSWGVEASFVRPLGTGGRIAARIALAHRDGSAFSDDNTGWLKGGDVLDATVSYSPNDTLTFALYGRNLSDERMWVSDVDLSVLLDATFSALREGRVIGLEVRAQR